MLTLNFEVFPNDEDAEAQARGVVAALVAIYGEGVVPASYVKIGEFERATGPVVINRYDAPAPDGYPAKSVDAEPINPREDAIGLDAPQRDVAGIPWDERIHASTKTTNKDGTWTRRRNTPDEVFDKVMAELKAANMAMTLEAAAGLAAPTPEPPQPSAAEAFTPPPSVVIPPAVPVAHVPTPPVPAVPAPPAPVAVAPDDTAAEPVEIMKAVNAKRVPADKLQEIIGKAGLDGLAKVFTAPIEARRIISAELAAL